MASKGCFSFLNIALKVSETSSLDKVSSEVDNLFLFDFELKSSYCLQGAPTVDTQIATSTHSSSQSENFDRNLAMEYRTLFSFISTDFIKFSILHISV
ncbi:hypothetical protein FF38_02789 [Lucilia cuprina]|uniref:Uncharacterized protein n=1 Tax=Lucilia cuprina TaxID=7375 RepID=A0A0L0BLK7_LUCCU|nr:hypothetical protein FF38_02789 [Lucilia cuprina]